MVLGAERREEDEAARPGALGRAHQPQRGHRVQLLDRGARLVADRRGQVDDGVHAAQRVPERRRVGEVAERDLHAHARVAEPARIAHQAAHRLARGRQAPQKGAADRAAGAGEQDHRRPA